MRSRLRLRAGPIALLSCLLPFVTASGAAAEVCLDVRVRFLGSPPPDATLEAMRLEATSIWDAYGLRLSLRQPDAATPCDLVLGSFDVVVDDAAEAGGRASDILGSTELGHLGIDAVPIRIHRRVVRQLLDSLTLAQTAQAIGRLRAGPSDLGRALGRVLAHEIGHVILDVSRHEHRGLMRAAFSAFDLARPRRTPYSLSPREIDRLRRRERDLASRVAVHRAPAPAA